MVANSYARAGGRSAWWRLWPKSKGSMSASPKHLRAFRAHHYRHTGTNPYYVPKIESLRSSIPPSQSHRVSASTAMSKRITTVV